ncbi:MAG TPA: molybdenum cofactor biosynthesis protein, partial [Thermoplasmata archaeon]|nr:molybdenum cofactor biosynthesis protein [Thermoplasmata archaeon]
MAAPHEHKAHAPASVKVGVVTISDSRTPETDESGQVLKDLLQKAGHSVLFYVV